MKNTKSIPCNVSFAWYLTFIVRQSRSTDVYGLLEVIPIIQNNIKNVDVYIAF